MPKSEQGLSKEQLLHFKESGIYEAFMATVGLRVKDILNDLCNKEKTKTLEDVRYLQGELTGAKFWEMFTDRLLKETEDDS